MDMRWLFLFSLLLLYGCTQNDLDVDKISLDNTSDSIEVKSLDNFTAEKSNVTIVDNFTNSSSDIIVETVNLTDTNESQNLTITENLSNVENSTYPFFPMQPTFQWILTPKSDWSDVLSSDADVIDVDAFETPEWVINRLHDKDRIIIAYVSVGSLEIWRPDADEYPKFIVGNSYPDWEDEYFVNIKRRDTLGPILEKRLDLIKDKGFDGVEADNIDLHTFDTGFHITEKDVVEFYKWLSNETHSRGLLLCQKNAPELSSLLVDYSDCMIWEDPYDYDNVDYAQPYVMEHKPVFAVFYEDNGVTISEFKNQICPKLKSKGYIPVLKRLDLDDWIVEC